MIEIIFVVSFAVIGYVYIQLYNDCIERLLDKKSGWFNRLLLSLAVIVYVSLLYTWLPHKLGYAISLFDDAFVLEGGAIYQNLMIMCIVTALSIFLGLLSHIWKSIRRKVKFSGRFFFLEVFFIAAFVFVAIRLSNNFTVLEFSNESDTKFLAGFIIVGFFLAVRIKKRLTEPYL